MQVLPHKDLLPFIKHYIFLECSSAGTKKLRLFSDGNTGIVFSLQKKLQCNFIKSIFFEDLPNPVLYGQLTDFKEVQLVGDSSLVIVVFQPAGLHNILGIPATELQDMIIGLEDLLGRKGRSVYEQLVESSGITTKLALLNNFFKSLLLTSPFKTTSFIEPALDYICKNNGNTSVAQLVKFTGYTERHIERHFASAVGLSPKKFANIVRLHFFIREIKTQHQPPHLTAAAYHAGYSDQSHLVKEFKKYTGITPGEYLYKTEKFTSNFIGIN